MPKIYPSKGTFCLVTKGIHPAVCCEFLDLGIVETKWGKKPKGAWIFQVNELDDDGKRKEVKCKFNLTVGTVKKPSKVQKLMGKWRGEAYDQDELENGDVDPERTVGQPCLLDIEHTTLDDGTTIHYIDGILPPGDVRLQPEGYVPTSERETSTPSGNGNDRNGTGPRHEDPEESEAPVVSGAHANRPPF